MGLMRGRGRSEMYWDLGKVTRKDMMHLKLTEDMTLDRRLWRSRIRAEVSR